MLVLFVVDLLESPAGEGLLSICNFSFESEEVFAGFEGLPGVAFLLNDPPNRSESMSSKPCIKQS